MSTTLTSKGQVTIPKHIRDALDLQPGTAVDFVVDDRGSVVLRPAARKRGARAQDRFDAARGLATVPWRTEALMRLLRDEA